MATVRSAWESAPIPMTGLLDAAHWSSATTLPMSGFTLQVQNDATGVDIGIDVTADQGNDPGTGDYFWFVIDVDNNGAVTPNRDVLYGPWPGQPNRLGRWLMAGPNATWPSAGAPIASTCHEGFGPSPHSAPAHRQWQMRLQFSELGITIDPTAAMPPVIRFGLHLASSTPGFVQDTPANPLADFGAFNEIILATRPEIHYPAGTAGAVIGGVGLIPANTIGSDGYATALPAPYPINPDEAAFGGTLEIVGNASTLTALWASGARKYKVLQRFGNNAAEVSAAAWAPLRRQWVNLRWNGATSVADSFAPDANDMYPFPDPALDYSIHSLLCQWSTANEPNNIHQLRVEFYTAAGAAVPTTAQIVTLRIDNAYPTAKVLNIRHGGAVVAACDMVTMTGPGDGVQIEFEAFDAEGDLAGWALTTEFGDGQTPPALASADYSGHRDATGHHIWHGESDATMPAAPGFVPPRTCAYLFRITASLRATNGYYWLGSVSDFKTVTLIVPTAPILKLKSVAEIVALPFGFGPVADGGKAGGGKAVPGKPVAVPVAGAGKSVATPKADPSKSGAPRNKP
jgi:hypothetical protein